MLFVTNLCETALLLKSVKPILYLGNVLLLRYVLIYDLVNLEVSFNFHLTFLQLTGMKTLNTFRACLHGLRDPGLVGLVSFVFTLWGTQNKRNLPH